ncbi:ParA family protein [Rhodanobacter sp. Soil772]|uniref:ParA family protein n=1 Tax=Rhodanobacter sp. Soil772 TaxID=1736406 RepID=UPI0009E9DFAB|nr:ParA family protein [Rhodanobacter sp. Soil772]
MKTISIFNNKGGVGKTTLTYHLAHALAEMGHKTLVIDLDPQCNLTILGMDEEVIHAIWAAEDDFIQDFEKAKISIDDAAFEAMLDAPRSIHFLLKPTEDGVGDIPRLPPPYELSHGLGLVPGRLTMHMYEDKISKLWSEAFQGDPQAVRTITKIRTIARAYASAHGYEFVIMDTSPSLGALNKVVISTTDGFLIPCMPDMFSLYGIRNIGAALAGWKKQFHTMYSLLSDEKRAEFPERFIKLLGFTIYNAKKYTAVDHPWNLATAHFNYAMQIPTAITDFIPEVIRDHLSPKLLSAPVGGESVMHGHNTLPGMAQKYHAPIWRVPDITSLETDDASTIRGNRAIYYGTRASYFAFAESLLERVALI